MKCGRTDLGVAQALQKKDKLRHRFNSILIDRISFHLNGYLSIGWKQKAIFPAPSIAGVPCHGRGGRWWWDSNGDQEFVKFALDSINL